MLDLLERDHDALKKTVAAGTVLLPEGANTGRLYVLVDGSVEISRNGTVFATSNDPGAIFGEMSVLLGLPHTATVKATVPSTVYEIKDATVFLGSDPAIALIIAKTLAQRLYTSTTYLVDLKKQYAGQSNHLGMVSDVLATLVFQSQSNFEPGSDREPDPQM
jgi:CRP/FNR family transcriptional regulator, cyclic AMP receptor protein